MNVYKKFLHYQCFKSFVDKSSQPEIVKLCVVLFCFLVFRGRKKTSNIIKKNIFPDFFLQFCGSIVTPRLFPNHVRNKKIHLLVTVTA